MAQSSKSKNVVTQINKELKETICKLTNVKLLKEPNFQFGPDNKISLHFAIYPNVGVWEGSKLPFEFVFSENYPQQSISIYPKFNAYHPNIDTHVCLNILSSGWFSQLRIVDYVGSLFWLLENPNFDSPLKILDQSSWQQEVYKSIKFQQLFRKSYLGRFHKVSKQFIEVDSLLLQIYNNLDDLTKVAFMYSCKDFHRLAKTTEPVLIKNKNVIPKTFGNWATWFFGHSHLDFIIEKYFSKCPVPFETEQIPECYKDQVSALFYGSCKTYLKSFIFQVPGDKIRHFYKQLRNTMKDEMWARLSFVLYHCLSNYKKDDAKVLFKCIVSWFGHGRVGNVDSYLNFRINNIFVPMNHINGHDYLVNKAHRSIREEVFYYHGSLQRSGNCMPRRISCIRLPYPFEIYKLMVLEEQNNRQ